MDIREHYDLLISENNDPVHDPEPLRAYMDGWDGARFLEGMQLDQSKSVLEIGVGTGRLALRVAPLCARLVGIDLSPKTVLRARENLSSYANIDLICGDFITYPFSQCFDVVYSSLTFFHIRDKVSAIFKVASLLSSGGRFLLSLDKEKNRVLDYGTRKIKLYPDDPEQIRQILCDAALSLADSFESDRANILVAQKR